MDQAKGEALELASLCIYELLQYDAGLEWLQQHFDLTDAQISKTVSRYPQIISHSVPGKMQPNLEWLQQRLDLTDAGLSKFVASYPALLGCNTSSNSSNFSVTQTFFGGLF